MERATSDEPTLRRELARAERRLREAEERFARLLELVPDALVLIDEDRRIRSANARAAELVGVESAEALVGRSILDFVPSEEAEAAQRQAAQMQGLERGRLHVLDVRGEPVPVEAALVPVPFEGGAGMLSRAHDLRRRRRIEQALSQTEDLFRKVFEASPAAISLTRLDDGKVMAANAAAQRMSGFGDEDFLGKSIADRWARPAQRADVIARVRRGEVVENEEVEVRTADGGRKTFQGSFQQIEVQGTACLLAVVLDVSAQRQTEAALDERDAVLRAFYDTVPSMMGVVEIHGDDIFHVSDSTATAKFFGTTPEAMRRRYASDLGVPPDILQKWAAAYRQSKADAAPVRLEYLHEWERGSSWLSATLAHIQTLPDGTDRYSYVIADVTEQKQAEQELIEAKERAEDIARLRSAILNNLTHEVRTPLTVILGFTSMLRKGVRPQFVRFVNLIERSGRRLMLMLDTILDLAQLEAGTLDVVPTPVDAAEIVEGAVEALRPQAEAKGIEIVWERPSAPLSGRLDQRILTRVLHNLLDNAVKFTDEGQIRVGLAATDDALDIHIQDTGVGIEAQFLDHIFEEFSQESTGLERTYQGSGLGLAVSKRLLERAGGTIAVESRKGRGSTFTIHLPRYAD